MKPSRQCKPSTIKLDAINRCDIPVTLQEVRCSLTGDSVKINAALPPNELVTKDLSCRIPENTPYSEPYWLRKPGTLGTFAVDDQQLIGLPENPPNLPVEIVLQINGQELRYTVDGKYRKVDPVAGELRRPLVIAPPVFTKIGDGALVYPTNQPKPVAVRVTAATGPVKGELKLAAPSGWRVDPPSVPIDLKGAKPRRYRRLRSSHRIESRRDVASRRFDRRTRLFIRRACGFPIRISASKHSCLRRSTACSG